MMNNVKVTNIMRWVLVANMLLFSIGLVRLMFLSPGTDSKSADSSDLHIKSNGRNLMAESGILQELHSSVKGAPCNCDNKGEESEINSPKGTNNKNDSSSVFKVPNIVHYIWFNTESVPIKFHQMLSVFSAHKILQPDVIYFHTNREPTGQYWDQIKSLPKLKVVYRDPPTKLFGEAVKEPFYYTSHSNVDRVNLLREYGGMYFDFDVLVTKPFDQLRLNHMCSMGLERDTQACGSVICCSKDSIFLKLWINAYLDDYKIEEWAYNTGMVPFKLWKRFPEYIHMEEKTINRPNFNELEYIWGPKTFDWQNNYAVHTWYRLWKDRSEYFTGVEPDPTTIKTMNNTFGQIARSILFGKPDLIDEV